MSHDPTEMGSTRPVVRPADHRETRDGATRWSTALQAFARAMEQRRREQAETALRPQGRRGYTDQEHEAVLSWAA